MTKKLAPAAHHVLLSILVMTSPHLTSGRQFWLITHMIQSWTTLMAFPIASRRSSMFPEGNLHSPIHLLGSSMRRVLASSSSFFSFSCLALNSLVCCCLFSSILRRALKYCKPCKCGTAVWVAYSQPQTSCTYSKHLLDYVWLSSRPI